MTNTDYCHFCGKYLGPKQILKHYVAIEGRPYCVNDSFAKASSYAKQMRQENPEMPIYSAKLDNKQGNSVQDTGEMTEAK
jgi:hypothetical protein